MIDTEALANEYIQGSATLKQLAEAHGVPLKELQRLSRSGGWSRLRAERRAGPRPQPTPEPASSSAEDRRLLIVLEAVDRLADSIRLALADREQLYRYFVPERDPETGATAYVDRTAEKLNTRALRDYANTLKDLADLKMNISHIGTLHDEREAQRLELLRRRLESYGTPDRQLRFEFEDDDMRAIYVAEADERCP